MLLCKIAKFFFTGFIINMKIEKIQNNINFNGYKNVISHTYQDKENNVFYSYMGMQLNNEGEYKDLDTWKEINKGLTNKKNKTNDIVFQFFNQGKKLFLTINDIWLQPINAEDQQNEKLILKAYTLIASLTRRIINTDFPPEDENLYMTLVAVKKHLETFVTKDALTYLWAEGGRKSVKHYVTAEIINNHIDKSMKKYFKIK